MSNKRNYYDDCSYGFEDTRVIVNNECVNYGDGDYDEYYTLSINDIIDYEDGHTEIVVVRK